MGKPKKPRAKSVKGNGTEEGQLQAAFGPRLARLRVALDMTQEQLGALVGRSAGAVGSWEEGKAWAPQLLIFKLCQRYRLTSDFIYYGERGGLTRETERWLIEKGVIEASIN